MNDTLLGFISKPEYFEIKDIDKMLPEIFKDYEAIKTYKKVSYINMPVSFDIETTSFISEYSEKSSVHLAPAEYSLSIGYEYARYLLSIQTKEL